MAKTRNHNRVFHFSFFEAVGGMLAFLDDYFAGYNIKRPRHGRNMNGRIPQTGFIAGLPRTQPK